MRTTISIALFILISSQLFCNIYTLEDVRKMIVGKWKCEDFYKGKLKFVDIREYTAGSKLLAEFCEYDKSGVEKQRGKTEMKYRINEANKKSEINQFILATQIDNEIHLMDICFDGLDRHSFLFFKGNKIFHRREYTRLKEKQDTLSKEIKIGMTEDEVIKCFGEPERMADLGGKKIFRYIDMKITFENGKVVDAEFD